MDFLESEDLTQQLTGHFDGLEGTAEDRWDSAHEIVRSAALKHSRDNKKMEGPQVLPFLLSSTIHHVTPQGWKFLASEGMSPTTHARAYSQLVSLHERDQSYKVGTLLLAKLKGLIAGDTNIQTSQKERTQQINKLMNEFQARKRLWWVRNNGGQVGQVLSDPVAIAQAMELHLTKITSPGLTSVEDCMSFL